MSSYSLMDVVCTLSGPTGDVDLSYGAAIADEAIEFTPAEDKNTLTVGGDGSPMNSLHAAQHGTITVRVLKTSPANALLMAMYDAQSLSSSLWGQNVIIARQTAAGDVNTGSSVAFKKKPAIKYNKVGDLMEWTFDAGKMTSVLGTY